MKRTPSDGRDAEFATQPNAAPKGRYAYFVDRDQSGTFNIHPLTSIFTPGQGDYYLLPQKSQKDTLIEPYTYAYNGIPTLLTSVAAPIVSQGKLWGVVTSDISLASLQEKVNKNQTMGWHGLRHAAVSAGNVVSYPDKTRPVSRGGRHTQQHVSGRQHDALLGEDGMVTWQPIVIGNSDRNGISAWSRR
ncbi:cache domain-containing protein (plasmid) [Pseudomonas silvicola]|nr:cache domain-containing protein [Pseudomonas silvicola]